MVVGRGYHANHTVVVGVWERKHARCKVQITNMLEAVIKWPPTSNKTRSSTRELLIMLISQSGQRIICKCGLVQQRLQH